MLPKAKHPIRFNLLRAWLHRCNVEHSCFDRLRSESILPTRLLFIGDLDTDVLSICLATELDDQDFVALSHCWGELSEADKGVICTTSENLSIRRKGFGINDLPMTFRDAIQVTRELGIQYLWIDSLCIIQGDDNDWENEAKRMESVFSSAYCVIAASSAASSREGFLHRDRNGQYVQITDTSGRRAYICADMDDFENDVNQSPLNMRWVMQERVLSRRTIHFSYSQMYWECGHGVCCENLNELKW